MQRTLFLFIILLLPFIVIGQNSSTENVFCDSVFDIKTKFHTYEVMPVYQGGQEELNHFIHDNLTVPEGADTLVKKVFVVFQIDFNGKVDQICAFNRSGYKNINATPLGKEILRVFMLMPKWSPATEYRKPVSVTMATIVNIE